MHGERQSQRRNRARCVRAGTGLKVLVSLSAGGGSMRVGTGRRLELTCHLRARAGCRCSGACCQQQVTRYNGVYPIHHHGASRGWAEAEAERVCGVDAYLMHMIQLQIPKKFQDVSSPNTKMAVGATTCKPSTSSPPPPNIGLPREYLYPDTDDDH